MLDQLVGDIEDKLTAQREDTTLSSFHFDLGIDDTCLKILHATFENNKIDEDWRLYVLFRLLLK